MASSLLALLSQQTPTLQTRRALLILGLQNDFLSPGGKLPVSPPSEFWHGMRQIVPAFREFGHVVWVRAESEANQSSSRNGHTTDDEPCIITSAMLDTESSETRPIGEKDKIDGERSSPVPTKRQRVADHESSAVPTPGAVRPSNTQNGPEHFLSADADGEECCLRGSTGAELCPEAKELVHDNTDILATTTKYSAFDGGSLLLRLRSKLITELFVCGGPTNSSVYATAMDAARYGFRINLIEDCLVSRSRRLNAYTLKRLCDVLEADIMTSTEAIDFLRNPPPNFDVSDEESDVWEDANEGLEVDDDLEEEEEEEDNDEASAPLEYVGNLRDARQTASSVVDDASVRPHSLLYDDLRYLRVSPTAAHNHLEREATARSGTPARGETNQDERLAEEACMNDRISLKTSGTTEPADRSEREPSITLKQDKCCSESSPAPTSMPANNSEACFSVQDFMKQSHDDRVAATAVSKHPGLNAIASIFNFDQKTLSEYETMMTRATSAKPPKQQPLFGTDKEVESAGSTISYDLLPRDLAETIFDKLNQEINWQRMYHQTGEVPRLVCCQGSIAEDGSRPVYRHPSDQTLPLDPWTPTVEQICKAAEEHVGHPFNHALIQLYRSGTDYISEHSDKTLDIAKESYIVNVSFGSQRTLRFRTKRGEHVSRPAEPGQQPPSSSPSIPSPPGPVATAAGPPRTAYRIPLPHNSLLKMSLQTNAAYLHGINADKRPACELSTEETAWNGQRISLTFRNVATFLDADASRIWGQGATRKNQEDALPVVIGDVEESGRLLRAFGRENQGGAAVGEGSWEEVYGIGSDVLHLR